MWKIKTQAKTTIKTKSSYLPINMVPYVFQICYYVVAKSSLFLKKKKIQKLPFISFFLILNLEGEVKFFFFLSQILKGR